MNWGEIRGNWEQSQSLLKTHWARLTDEDLTTINGDRAALADVLQHRYGLANEEAERAIAGFEKDVRRPGAVK